MSNGRVCANANCHHTEFEHVSDMCWGKPKEIRKDGHTPGCRCNGFVARRLCVASIDMSIKPIQRWRFVSDDDGHDYLIPAEKEQEFNEWVSSFEYEPHYEGEEPQEYTGPDFEAYRTSMSPNNYTFTDPKAEALDCRVT